MEFKLEVDVRLEKCLKVGLYNSGWGRGTRLLRSGYIWQVYISHKDHYEKYLENYVKTAYSTESI